jgi:hypothetical protein
MRDHMGTDVNDIFHQTSTYIGELIAREQSPFQLARVLNDEVPAKMEDTRRSLLAVLEERLAERGDKLVSNLSSGLRIRYYEDRIVSKLVAECSIAEWSPWKSYLSKYIQKTGVVLMGSLSLAFILIALNTMGITSIYMPVWATSTASLVIIAALAVLSGIAATHPEKVPTLMEREQGKARQYVATYLRDAEIALLDSARKAEEVLDAYLEQLQEGNSIPL